MGLHRGSWLRLYTCSRSSWLEHNPDWQVVNDEEAADAEELQAGCKSVCDCFTECGACIAQWLCVIQVSVSIVTGWPADARYPIEVP